MIIVVACTDGVKPGVTTVAVVLAGVLLIIKTIRIYTLGG